ncbi:MAG: AAA family ATPase, partial [Bacilli bacterium]
MLITKISLTNFRNFKNSEILFSCNPEKSFTIILGQNTYGKTTLVKSFIRCLYKNNNFNDKILLNKDVADSMPINSEKQVIVEIELEHKDTRYVITTRESYYKNSAGKISVSQKAYSSMRKMINNNLQCIDPNRIEDEIDSILQSDLKEYFFFDGETNAIEKIRTKRNLTTAVTNILGLKNIEKLAEYYSDVRKDSVISSLSAELISNDEGVLSSLKVDLEECLQRHEDKAQEKLSLEVEREKLIKRIDDLENTMNENKEIIDDQERKKEFKRKIDKSESNKTEYFNNIIKSINKESSFLKILFAYYFNKCNFPIMLMQSSFTSEKSYKCISEDAVNDLIKNGKCICGAIIKDGNDAYNHLLLAKEHMEPHDYSKYILDFKGSEIANLD